jgi:hypothetical protein
MTNTTAREKALAIAKENPDLYNDFGEFFPNEREIAFLVQAIENGVQHVEITHGYGPFGCETRAVIDGKPHTYDDYARAAKAVCDYNNND